MQCTLTHCSVTHGNKNYIVSSFVFFSKSNARTHWNLSPNDTMPPHKISFFVKKVH